MYVCICAYVCNTYILSSREEEVVGLRASRGHGRSWREGTLEWMEGEKRGRKWCNYILTKMYKNCIWGNNLEIILRPLIGGKWLSAWSLSILAFPQIFHSPASSFCVCFHLCLSQMNTGWALASGGGRHRSPPFLWKWTAALIYEDCDTSWIFIVTAAKRNSCKRAFLKKQICLNLWVSPAWFLRALHFIGNQILIMILNAVNALTFSLWSQEKYSYEQ